MWQQMIKPPFKRVPFLNEKSRFDKLVAEKEQRERERERRSGGNSKHTNSYHEKKFGLIR